MEMPAQTGSRTEYEYDLFVLGSGEGGKFAAWHFARTEMRVGVVERKYIGGSCPNIACLPSKNLIHSANSGKKRDESLRKSRMDKNCVAESRVRDSSEHGDLNYGHDLASSDDGHREAENAIAVSGDQLLHESRLQFAGQVTSSA